jgi:hypothetical protein
MNTTDQHDETRQGEALVQEGSAGRKKLYLESYGCQMNFSDSEIVASLLQKEGYETTNKPEEADLVLLNTFKASSSTSPFSTKDIIPPKPRICFLATS